MKKQLLLLSLLFYGILFSYAQSGINLFDDTFIHEIEINSIEPYSYNRFHDTLWASQDRTGHRLWELKQYYKASVTIDGTTLDTIGIRYKGLSTFQHANEKWAMKLDFNEYVRGQEYDGLKKINLHNHVMNPTCMRLKLAFEILSRMDVPAPRVAYAKITLNGSYRGVYSIVEQIDKTFVKDHFTPDSVGYLHKAWNMPITLDTSQFVGQDTTYYELTGYCPLKTRKKEDNYKPFIDFVIDANHIPDNLFEEEFDKIFNIKGFIDQTAATLIMSDRDHYCKGCWNFYLYLDPGTGKWNMIPWDYNLAFGINQVDVENPVEYQHFGHIDCLLTNRTIVDNNKFKEQYRDALCTVLNDALDSTWVNQRMLTLADLLRSELATDPYHFCPGTDFELYLDQTYTVPPGLPLAGVAVPPLRGSINDRYQQVRQQLADVGNTCIDDDLLENNDLINDFHISVFPNPTSGYLSIKSDIALKKEVVLNDVLGRSTNLVAENNLVDMTNLPAGIYNLVLTTDITELSVVIKIIKLKF